MKSSRTFIRNWLVNKTLINIRKLDGQLPQVQPKSLLTSCCVPSKPLNSRFSYLGPDSNTPLKSEQQLPSLLHNKVEVGSIKVLFPFGPDKSLTLLSNSSHLNGSYNSSTTTSSLRESKIMVNHFNSELLSPQDISRVFSAPSSRTQLIPWSANCTVKVNQKVQSGLK
jgi:hypothetical protein